MATPMCDGRAAVGAKDAMADQLRTLYDLGRAAPAV